jgi:hypothetical protein
MCWNAKVSLNTFLFSIFAIILAYINGYNPRLLIVYFFFASVQLDEFFLWKYLKNNDMNQLFSRVLGANIFIQPFALTYLISNPTTRNIYIGMLAIYSFCALFTFTSMNPKMENITVADNGHLAWHWLVDYEWLFPIYLFFYSALLVEKMYVMFALIVITFIFSFYSYNNEKTFGSMWCWTSNIIAVYIVLKILFYDNIPCKFF